MADNGHPDDATAEEIWAILREVAASQRETDRRMQETDRRMQETDERLRKLDELFNGQWGKLMEALVEGDLVKLLSQRGIEVDHTVCNLKSRNGATGSSASITNREGFRPRSFGRTSQSATRPT